MTTFNVKDYGALGDNSHNDTQAFIDASTALRAAGGGTLLIPFGVYRVGLQTLAGQMGKGYAYSSVDVINISGCSKPVVIEGCGAIIRAIDNLHYGSFDPVTGNPYYPASMPFTNANYAAGAYRLVVLLNNTDSVTVRNLEIDGNNTHMIIGGGWGDKGIQLNGYGILSMNNAELLLSNIYVHHTALDGVYISQGSTQTPFTPTSARTPVTLIQVRSEYNGRQGMSWGGGSGLTAINCQFNHTGRGGVGSSPQAGVDIEAERGAIRNGLFINCEMINNVGLAMGSDSGDSADVFFNGCTFLGTTNFTMLTRKPRMHYQDCTISGMIIKPGTESPVKLPDNPVDSGMFLGNASHFSQVRFTDKLTYGGQVYAPSNSYLVNFGAGARGVQLSQCVIESTQGAAGFSYDTPTLQNCHIYQTGLQSSALRPRLLGDSVIEQPGSDYTTSGGIENRDRVMRNSAEFRLQTHGRLPQYTFRPIGATYNVRIGHAASPQDFVGTENAQRGDIVYNTAAVAGGVAGWVCVAAGAPGVWKPFATLAN